MAGIRVVVDGWESLVLHDPNAETVTLVLHQLYHIAKGAQVIALLQCRKPYSKSEEIKLSVAAVTTS